ncbi:hypothetical protein [Prauserella muralis]|uniref:Uncharacterized protein n=1 Tax=Prauserella muralis TaxID=588067 RepID=A0A2V4B768_9PSEU|nr:hypothetical protein [Prauserella muralis]PXY31225.1 hypothetical protein BAY60_02115 [Prauserella muralis]TWE14472.1 hypothetical protein FHX69_6621 [Prauserella muralis]
MVDVHDGLPKDGFAVPLRLHNVLLALAGRLDDSALSEARELVARSHLDDAAELTTGALIAGRIMVRPPEQRELALVLEMSRSDASLADQLTVGEAVPGYTHRFSRENEPERGISEALGRTLEVLPDLRSVHAVWRNTPAGSVPGPLPTRVVLVEVGPEAHPPAVAFRVDDALRRSGIRSVVEVTGPGAERTEYHEAALAAATPVWLATGQSSGGSASWSSRAPRARAAGGAHTAAEASREPAHAAPDFEEPAVAAPRVAQQPEPQPQPQSQPEPAPVAKAESGEQAEPEPGPAERENRAAATTEMTKEEVAQLRAAIAEDPEKGRLIAGVNGGSGDVVELPELDLDDPQLSERDRQLLRELHAELAERERAEAAKARMNGAEQHWADGFSGA